MKSFDDPRMLRGVATASRSKRPQSRDMARLPYDGSASITHSPSSARGGYFILDGPGRCQIYLTAAYLASQVLARHPVSINRVEHLDHRADAEWELALATANG